MASSKAVLPFAPRLIFLDPAAVTYILHRQTEWLFSAVYAPRADRLLPARKRHFPIHARSVFVHAMIPDTQRYHSVSLRHGFAINP